MGKNGIRHDVYSSGKLLSDGVFVSMKNLRCAKQALNYDKRCPLVFPAQFM